MTKTVLAALAVLFTLSAPAFASITGDHRAVVQQEEPASSPSSRLAKVRAAAAAVTNHRLQSPRVTAAW